MNVLKKMAAKLPEKLQLELKRLHFSRQIAKEKFEPSEPEYELLPEFLSEGDWVIDIGANVGQYTKRFSELVGRKGRVLAFEPVPETFSLLAANSVRFSNKNVSLFNAAVSNVTDIVGISIPTFQTGLSNYYEAQVSAADEKKLTVMTIAVDFLNIDSPVALIKIDAEGHEAYVLEGMRNLIDRYRPILIVETGSQKIIEDFESKDYLANRLPKSPNIVLFPKEKTRKKKQL